MLDFFHTMSPKSVLDTLKAYKEHIFKLLENFGKQNNLLEKPDEAFYK
jgi:hypothetical protein